MNHVLRYLFFVFVVYPMTLILIGLNVRRRELLPQAGPALIVANHNSHLDALTLISLFGLKRLRYVRPVAAADFFLRNRLLGWFSTRVIGIIPLDRAPKGTRSDPLAGIVAALERSEILILFPEGTRGEPEQLAEFKTGVAHVAKRSPETSVTPIYMHGLGKSLPRGEALFVPFFCDIFVGEALHWTGNRGEFMDLLNQRMESLAAEGTFPDWN